MVFEPRRPPRPAARSMVIYRLLLWLYPASFRAEYGTEMELVFAAKLRAASGLAAVLALCWEALSDVFRHAIPLHAEVLRQDVRHATRSLTRSPGFALAVIVITGLGIGANTAVFTVADVVLARPVPFDEPDRLVRVWERPPGYDAMEVSPPNYLDWRAFATSFESMAAYHIHSANLVGANEPVRVQGSAVGSELMSLLGVGAALGRTLTVEDELPGAPQTIVLSHGLWQRGFGGETDIIGRTLVLDDVAHTVIGVMPAGFQFPDQRSEYWKSVRFWEDPSNEDRNNNYLGVVARLRPGVSLEQARAEMRAVMARLEAAHPVENENNSATVNRLTDEVPAQARLLLVALLGASACVLLIACTNLTSLLLARAAARRQELAVRSSLGASPERLVRQLLTESIVLALLGGIVGVLLARIGLPLLLQLVPESIPLAGTPTVDGRVLLFAFGLTLVAGLGFGVLPALRAGRRVLVADLRASTRDGGGRRERVRAVLVVVQVSASVALLITSGLLLRALSRVETTDPGFRAEGVLTLRTWLPWPRYGPVAEQAAFYDRVVSDVRALPGVSNAAYTSFLPLVMGGGIWPVELEGQTQTRSGGNTASLRFVTPGYFETMGIPIRRGRDVSAADTQDRPYVAVVSESFVERYWPDHDPIGRTFQFGFFERTVVGVVGDVRVRGLERTSEPQVYLPHGQTSDFSLIFYAPKDLAVHTSGDPMRLVPAIREIVRRADPTQPITSVQTLESIVAANTTPRRVQVHVLATFAALAILLAALGIHGLLSYTATQRAREIGVRIALGAHRSGILAMVLREGVVLGVIGVAGGATLGYAAGQTMQALLAGVQPGDAMTFGLAIGTMLVVTIAGSLIPAVRAARVDANALLRDS